MIKLTILKKMDKFKISSVWPKEYALKITCPVLLIMKVNIILLLHRV